MLHHLRTRWPILAGFLVVGFGIIAAEQWGLYYTIEHFDKFLHVLGGMVAAWFVVALLQNDIAAMRWWRQILIVVSVACFIGVIWEWAEYAANSARTSAPWLYHYFHGGDLVDTISDLIADTAGAFVVALWLLRKKHD